MEQSLEELYDDYLQSYGGKWEALNMLWNINKYRRQEFRFKSKKQYRYAKKNLKRQHSRAEVKNFYKSRRLAHLSIF